MFCSSYSGFDPRGNFGRWAAHKNGNSGATTWCSVLGVAQKNRWCVEFGIIYQSKIAKDSLIAEAITGTMMQSHSCFYGANDITCGPSGKLVFVIGFLIMCAFCDGLMYHVPGNRGGPLWRLFSLAKYYPEGTKVHDCPDQVVSSFAHAWGLADKTLREAESFFKRKVGPFIFFV
jgi:hypothetical protein